MKNLGSTCTLKPKKSKNKLNRLSNNFSEKLINFTNEKMSFSTPKISSIAQNKILSPKCQRIEKSVNEKKRSESPYTAKQQRININMEINNFNVFNKRNNAVGSGDTPVLHKKKRLHKKTISCLNAPPNKENMLKNLYKSKSKVRKHTKAHSQENLRSSPQKWIKVPTKVPKNSQEVVTKFSLCNRCGASCDNKSKVNQDAYVVVQNFMGRGKYLFGVCDGHGINGHFVSQFVKEILPENIEYSFLKNKNHKTTIRNSVESSLKEAFQRTSRNLIQSGIDVMFSGTTTCLIYIHNHDLFCANLGDSRAVLYSKQAEQWSCSELSIDHKAEDKREAIRIQMNGGRVFPYQDEDGQWMGPHRIWLKDQEIPGLAMTRSFGDYIASTVGVIDEPEIIHHTITQQNKFVVIATDGLWEFISNEQVLDVVTSSFMRNDPESAVKDLEKMAVQAWKREDESVDDITIIVIFFKYY